MKNSTPKTTATVAPFPPISGRFDPPEGLTPEAVARWRGLQDEYGIVDAGGLSILRLHCEALMTARDAEAILTEDGLTTTDRFGQAKGHPAAAILRDARAQMLATLRALNLDVVPKHDHVGRPGGGR